MRSEMKFYYDGGGVTQTLGKRSSIKRFARATGQLLEFYDAEEAACDERCDALAH